MQVDFTFRTLAGVGAHVVPAAATVLARSRFALVDVLLAVGAAVSILAVAAMRVSDCFAGAVIAKILQSNS